MSGPSMVVRIAANLDELRKNLAEGKNQIEATTAGMSKMAASLQGDKIIQQAHNVAAAVNQVGGAAKLTAVEQERVNAIVEKALAKYQALGQEAPQALRELADQTKRVESASTSWGGQLNSVVTGAVAGLSAAVSNFALNVLANATRNLGEFIARGGQVSAMRSSFDALAGGVDAAQSRIDSMRVATRGLVDEMAIMQASNKATLLGLGLNDEQMANLARTSVVLGRAMGQDATKSLDDMIVALGRSSPLILDNFGLSVKLGEANEKYAAALGKTADALTDAEKKQAFMNAAMDAANAKVAQLGEVNLTAADRITQVWTSVKNITDAFAGWLVNLAPVNAALDALVWRMSALEGLFRGGPKEALKAYEQAMAESRGEAQKLTEQVKTVAQASVDMAVSHQKSVEVEKQLTETVREHSAARVRHVEVVRAAAPVVQEFTGLQSRSLQETGKLTQALERWANTNGAVLAPSIRQVNTALGEQMPLMATANTSWATFAPTVQQHTAAAATSTGGFMDRLRGLFGGGGEGGGGGSTLSNMLNTIGPQFAAAFMGPGSATDKLKMFATQGLSALMGMIPHVGPWLQAFSGPIIDGLSKLASKARDLLSGIFGGPSQAEKDARERVAAFEDQLRSALTEQQRLEAGGERWKEVVIAVRDAYLAQGYTAEQANAAVERLWKSSRDGGRDTQAAIDAINAVLRGTGQQTLDFVNDVGDALNRLPRNIDIDINGRWNEDRPPGFATGSGGIRDFGTGTLAVLHGRERVQTEAQMLAEQRGGGGGNGGGGAGGVTVHVDARGALMGDYASQQQLARLVNDAVMQTLGMQRTLGLSSGVA